MTQETMFRGKRVDNGEWVYGDLIKHYENQRIFIAYDQLFYTYADCGINKLVTERFYEVKAETIGQFIGLTDKHEVEIYEGDILATEKRDVMFIIIWDRFSCGFKFKDNFDGCLLNIDLKALRKIEVIGNIHDNPDLLEKGDNNG